MRCFHSFIEWIYDINIKVIWKLWKWSIFWSYQMTLTRFQVPYPSTSLILEACWIVGSVYGHYFLHSFNSTPTCFNLYWVCCLLRDFKNLGLLFCFTLFYYCYYSTLITHLYTRGKKRLQKQRRKLYKKKLKKISLSLNIRKKDIDNEKICHKALQSGVRCKRKACKAIQTRLSGVQGGRRQKRVLTLFRCCLEKCLL